MTLRVLIVDDEPLARASLRSLLEPEPDVHLVGECRNGKEALEALLAGGVDLVFLDVQMPGLTGFDVLETLPAARRPLVVFVTAYEEFALRAFEVHAIDYLVKPFDDERFARALARARELFARGAGSVREEQRADRRPAAPAGDGQSGPHLERITISREGSIEVLPVEELVWIEAADQYVNLHSLRGEHLMRESMAHFEEALDPARFLRVHRSAIVRLSAVRRLESLPGSGGRAHLEDGSQVPVSRSRLPVLRRRLAGRA